MAGLLPHAAGSSRSCAPASWGFGDDTGCVVGEQGGRAAGAADRAASRALDEGTTRGVSSRPSAQRESRDPSTRNSARAASGVKGYRLSALRALILRRRRKEESRRGPG